MKKSLFVAACLAFLMLLTRGSHTLTTFSLPDASLVLFLLGGILLKRWGWFAAFFVLGAVIDFGAAALGPAQGFCLTNGYWGLIPSYAGMWLGGLWLGKQHDAFAIKPFISISAITSFIAFVISTQTYYLYSGRFPNDGVLHTMQYGWNYLPDWMLVNVAYSALTCLVVALARNNFKLLKPASL
jgi:hypothetical protein